MAVIYTLMGVAYTPVIDPVRGIVLRKAARKRMPSPGQMSLFGSNEPKQGDTKVVDGVTYQLNQHSRWEKTDKAKGKGQSKTKAVVPVVEEKVEETAPAKAESKAKVKSNPSDVADIQQKSYTDSAVGEISEKMILTKSQQELIDDAKKAGYEIDFNSSSVDVYKKRGKKIDIGIRLTSDGTAYRIDIDLGSAITIRTQKQMREILKLKPKNKQKENEQKNAQLSIFQKQALELIKREVEPGSHFSGIFDPKTNRDIPSSTLAKLEKLGFIELVSGKTNFKPVYRLPLKESNNSLETEEKDSKPKEKLTFTQQEALDTIKKWMSASGRTELDFKAYEPLVLRHYISKPRTFSAATTKALIEKGYLEVIKTNSGVNVGARRNPYTHEPTADKGFVMFTVKVVEN